MGHLKHFATSALHDLDKPNLQFLVNSQHFWFPGPASSFPHAFDTPVLWWWSNLPLPLPFIQIPQNAKIDGLQFAKTVFFVPVVQKCQEQHRDKLRSGCISSIDVVSGGKQRGLFLASEPFIYSIRTQECAQSTFFAFFVTSLRKNHFEQSYISYKLCK